VRGRLLATAALALLLAGCASSPRADLNGALTDVTNRANARDAAGLRLAVDRLVEVVNRQSGSSLPLEEAQRIRDDAAKVKAGAALLEPAPTPAPTTAPPSPTPSPTPRPLPSTTPTPPPSPPPSETPSPTPSSPSPSPTPTKTKGGEKGDQTPPPGGD